jgi:hypothetical protein
VALVLGLLGFGGDEVLGGEPAGAVDLILFPREAPAVVEFVAEASAGGEEPHTLSPALSTRRGDAEAFQGIDGDQPEPVVDGCLKRSVPGVFVTRSGAVTAASGARASSRGHTEGHLASAWSCSAVEGQPGLCSGHRRGDRW